MKKINGFSLLILIYLMRIFGNAQAPQPITLQSNPSTFLVFGSVVDRSNAFIVGAEVILQKVGQADTRETTTNKKGRFKVSLLAGLYNLKIKALGFDVKVIDKINISSGNIDLGNIKMNTESRPACLLTVTSEDQLLREEDSLSDNQVSVAVTVKQMKRRTKKRTQSKAHITTN